MEDGGGRISLITVLHCNIYLPQNFNKILFAFVTSIISTNVCTTHYGISSDNSGVQVTTDSLQHEAHNEIYEIDVLYDQ